MGGLRLDRVRDGVGPDLAHVVAAEQMTPRCIHGHLYTEKNTRWTAQTRHGITYHARQCKTCHRNRVKLKYRFDADFRAAEKARGRALYEKRRDATVPRRRRRTEERVQ